MAAALQAVMAGLKYIPASLGMKALTRINPKFKNFFTEAASYGIDTNRAIDYLTDRFSNPSTQQFEGQLEQGANQGTLRPDEMAARSEISNANIPSKLLKGAASFGGAGLALGSGESDQQEQAAQAASPNSGGAGQATQGGPSPQPQAPAQQPQGNPPGFNPASSFLIQFPELGKFMEEQIAQGIDPQSAAALARKKRLLAPIIQKIEKKTREDFGQLASRLFGGSQQQGSSQGKSQFLEGLNQLAGMIQSLKGK